MRGEEVYDRGELSGTAGSPPHARGGGPWAPVAAGQAWITPACAGRRRPVATGPDDHADHPRMRGEESPLPSSSTANLGSPPHARGGVIPHMFNTANNRITPACAGRRDRHPRPRRRAPDHPRMRGEERSVWSR